jgi:hypothetical protein
MDLYDDFNEGDAVAGSLAPEDREEAAADERRPGPADNTASAHAVETIAILENNLSALFTTAKLEIERKDDEIRRLRALIQDERAASALQQEAMRIFLRRAQTVVQRSLDDARSTAPASPLTASLGSLLHLVTVGFTDADREAAAAEASAPAPAVPLSHATQRAAPPPSRAAPAHWGAEGDRRDSSRHGGASASSGHHGPPAYGGMPPSRGPGLGDRRDDDRNARPRQHGEFGSGSGYGGSSALPSTDGSVPLRAHDWPRHGDPRYPEWGQRDRHA